MIQMHELGYQTKHRMQRSTSLPQRPYLRDPAGPMGSTINLIVPDKTEYQRSLFYVLTKKSCGWQAGTKKKMQSKKKQKQKTLNLMLLLAKQYESVLCMCLNVFFIYAS